MRLMQSIIDYYKNKEAIERVIAAFIYNLFFIFITRTYFNFTLSETLVYMFLSCIVGISIYEEIFQSKRKKHDIN